MHRAACGCASGLRGYGRRAGAGRVAVRGREQIFGGEWVVRSAGVHWRCVGESGSVREGRVAVRGRAEVLGKGASGLRGRAKVFGGEWVVRSAGLTHFRRSGSRVRVLLYIRPPRHRREIAAMGPKDAPCEHPSPTKTSAPAPSAFTLPRRRSHFLRIPFGLPLNDVRPCRARVHTSPAYPSATPTKTSASRSSSYPQWVIHGKVIHIVARRPVQNVLALAPAHAYI